MQHNTLCEAAVYADSEGDQKGNIDSMTINYQQPLWRPPSEGSNLIIQATYGCSFNKCSFCVMYRSKKYQARPLEAVMREIETAAHDWPDASRVFLADGDALVLPTNHLSLLLERLAQAFPRLTRVSCYATPSNILRKSTDELAQLRRHKLTLIYLGIESGSDFILGRINKGATRRSLSEALHKAHVAGLKVSGTVILGLGGTRHWEEHIDGTVALLNSAPLNQLSTLQFYLDNSISVEFHHRYSEPFEMPDDYAMLHELKRLIAGLNPPQPIIFRSNHASNALALEGNLPRDRDRLLAEIEQAMCGAKALRPNHLRGM